MCSFEGWGDEEDQNDENWGDPCDRCGPWCEHWTGEICVNWRSIRWQLKRMNITRGLSVKMFIARFVAYH